MMEALDQETVDFEPNYDDSRTQPTVLPGRFPNLLCNGSDGIAVGMATSLPPHNLREVCAALRAILDNSEVSLGELCQIVSGPDFPTGGIIMGRSGILRAYTTGRGHVKLRARYTVEDVRTKQQLVISEIPYQVRKVTIIDKIVEIVKDGRVTGISDVRDESDRTGIRLVIELKKGEDSQVVINQLFKFTPLQTTYSIINLAIGGRQPLTLTLRSLLDSYLEHREEVIRRRTKFQLDKAAARKHIVDGLRIAVGNIDEVIAIIRASRDRDGARAELASRFALSERQSQAIVDMRLGSLTGLEQEKLEGENAELEAKIADLTDILAKRERVLGFIREDLDELEARYGDERRTEISDEEIDGSFDMEELITEEMMVVTRSQDGYMKRVALGTYRAQGRGGRGVRGSSAKDGDVLASLFVASTHDYLLFFTNCGKVYWKKVYQLPEGGRVGKGRAIHNLIPLDEGEQVTNLLPVREFDNERCLMFATSGGTIKKTPLEAYSRPRTNGIRAIVLDEGDEVVAVDFTRPGDTVLLCGADGQSIRFDEGAARTMGRSSRGVRGIRLRSGDGVVGMVVTVPDSEVLTVCAGGGGKRTPVDGYPVQGRGGQGVINIRTTERSGPVVGVETVCAGDDVLFITESGMIVRTSAEDISSMGRSTQGVRLVNPKAGDRVVNMAVVRAADLARFDTEAAEGEAEVAATSDQGAADNSEEES
jgi:DNA gyrase subunit A